MTNLIYDSIGNRGAEAEKLKTFRRANFCVQNFPEDQKVVKFKCCDKKVCNQNFLDNSEAFKTLSKLSRQSTNFPETSVIFQTSSGYNRQKNVQ